MDGLTHSYRNIQNVIAKLESGTGAKHALLVNCHFDSVPQSAGERSVNVKTSNWTLKLVMNRFQAMQLMDTKHNQRKENYKCVALSVGVLLQVYVSVFVFVLQ